MNNISTKTEIDGVICFHCSDHPTVGEHYCASAESYVALHNKQQVDKAKVNCVYQCVGAIFYCGKSVLWNHELDSEDAEDSDRCDLHGRVEE